jgi:ABC-type proline/glycine betaine transport system ATPase subunit
MNPGLTSEILALSLEHVQPALFTDVREALLLGTRIALLKDGALELMATPAEFLAATGDGARAFVETR